MFVFLKIEIKHICLETVGKRTSNWDCISKDWRKSPCHSYQWTRHGTAKSGSDGDVLLLAVTWPTTAISQTCDTSSGFFPLHIPEQIVATEL